MVACSLGGTVARRKAPLELRDWFDGFHFEGAASYASVDIQIYLKVGQKEPGRISVRPQRNRRPHVPIAWILWASRGHVAGHDRAGRLRKSVHTPAGKYSAFHFSGIRQAPANGELDNAYRLQETANSADGLTGEKNDTVPLLRALLSGDFRPGAPRPLRGVSSNEVGKE